MEEDSVVQAHSDKAETGVTATVEAYLSTIYNQAIDDGRPVIGARLAERLGVKPATVSATIKRFRETGLVLVNEKNEISLTPRGEQLALTMMRRHRIAERFLVDVLGFAWHEAHEEAETLEHAISARLEERFYKFLGEPRTCPHGNPIPGAGVDISAEKPLSPAFVGQEVVVERITEEAENEPGMLKYLYDLNMGPGARLTVLSVGPLGDVLLVRNGDREVSLGVPTARKIRVVAAADAQGDEGTRTRNPMHLAA